MVTKAHH